MKTKLLIILCVMIFAGAVMVGPVAAVDAKSPITGNISSYIALTVTGTGISNWPLALGPTPNVNTSNVTLLLVCNYPGWTISALDAMDTVTNVKPVGSVGRMAESNAIGEYVAPNYYLETPMKILGTTHPSNVQYTASTEKSLTGSPQLIYTGDIAATGVGTFSDMPIKVTQLVTTNDAVLASGELYKIIVTFTALIP
jgi:hypothetical protein